jgi:hypothetical protein
MRKKKKKSPWSVSDLPRANDDWPVEPWLYDTYHKKYRVILREFHSKTLAEDKQGSVWDSVTLPHYAIPCETGVDIEEFGPGWLGPKELAVIVDPEDNPALVEQLKKKYVEEPEWVDKVKRGECDNRGRKFWGAPEGPWTLEFPAEDLDLLAPILRPLPRP